jgi:hypothetical protein
VHVATRVRCIRALGHDGHHPCLKEGRPGGWALRSINRQARASHPRKETSMGKYFIAWLLGVPAIFLVILYFFFH